MLIFESFVFKNLMSYGDTLTEIILNDFPTTHIAAPSGEGKSAIWDALCFALFGRGFRPANKAALINTKNNKDCYVKLNFSKNGIKYIVERGIKPNIFKIFKNGELIPEDSLTRDYQKFLEENILQFSFVSFCQVIMVGNVNFKPFMQLPPMDRRKFVEEILRSEIYTNMQVLAKQDLQELKNAINDLNFQKVEAAAKLNTIEKMANSLLENKEEKIREMREELSRENEIYDTLLKEETELNKKVSEIPPQPLAEKRKIYDKLMDMQRDLRGKENEISKYERVLQSEVCPHCHQPISPEFVKLQYESIEPRREKILSKKSEVLEKIDKVEVLIEKLEKNQEVIGKFKTKLNNLSYKLDAQAKVILKIENSINRENTEQSIIDEVEREELVSLLGEIEDQEFKLNNNAEYLNAVVEITKDNGIKGQIIKQYLQKINQKINFYLEELELSVQFTFDENFNETILSGYHTSLKYESFSSGERARIGVAMLLCWRDIAMEKNAIKTNLLVLDEIFMDSLDVNSVMIFAQMLKKRAYKLNENIKVMAHRQEIRGLFDNEITVKKVGGFSQVYQEKE